MPTRTFEPIIVVGRVVRTFIEVFYGDLVEISASGTVDFGGAVVGIGAPILGPDGDNWTTPPDYPAPDRQKNSLIVGVRSELYPYRTSWEQGGTNRSFRSPHHGYLVLAANDATPDNNSRGWSVSITVTTPPRFTGPIVRLRIERVEFVQSMQRTDNSVPLIAGKRTLVRVFVSSGRADMIPIVVRGSLNVQYPDAAIASTSEMAPGAAIADGSQNRDDLTSSLNFILPSNSSVGTATVQIRVFVPDHEAEVGYFAEFTTEATFVAPRGIAIRPFLIAVPARDLGLPSLDAATTVLTAAQQRLPMVEGLRVVPFSAYEYLLPFGDAPSWRNLLYTVGTVLPRINIGFLGQTDYIHVAFVLTPRDSATGGMGMYSPFINIPSAVCGMSDDLDASAEVCAHEMGHALGLNHALCGDPLPPVPWSSRLQITTEEPGWFASRNRMVAAGVPEMMTYCYPRWPSITAYRYIHNGHHD